MILALELAPHLLAPCEGIGCTIDVCAEIQHADHQTNLIVDCIGSLPDLIQILLGGDGGRNDLAAQTALHHALLSRTQSSLAPALLVDDDVLAATGQQLLLSLADTLQTKLLVGMFGCILNRILHAAHGQSLAHALLVQTLGQLGAHLLGNTLTLVIPIIMLAQKIILALLY